LISLTEILIYSPPTYKNDSDPYHFIRTYLSSSIIHVPKTKSNTNKQKNNFYTK